MSRFSSLTRRLRRNWKKLALLAVIFLVAGGIYAYQTQQNQPEPLTFEKPQRETLVKTLEVSGTVDAKEKARLRFAAGGKITYVGALEGEWVEKWQTVAVIDQASMRKELQKDLNTFKQERIGWDQILEDHANTPPSNQANRDKEIEQLNLDNAVLDVEIQDITIDNTVLWAPFAGILTLSPAPVAGVTILGSDYFEVVNPNTLVFRAAVDEADISEVGVGQSGELALDAYPDKPIFTTVNYIAFTSTESSSGTVFAVEFPVSQVPEANLLRLGMNGDISIEVARKNDVLSIPLIATRERDDKTYVDVKTGENTYEEREITTGLETDEKVEVISGLSESDEVLIPE